MTGLLLKDLYVIKSQSKSYFILMGFFLVLTLVGAYDATFFSGFIVLIMTMLPMSIFTYDDMARWPKFAAATPAGRRGVVRSKYLFSLCTLAAATVLLLALDLFYCAVRGAFSQLPELLLAGGVCLLVGLFLNLILIPILFRYGAEKGRLVMIGVFLLTFLVIYGGALLFSKKIIPLPALPQWMTFSLPVVVLGALAVGAVLSYSASLRIFGKKEL